MLVMYHITIRKNTHSRRLESMLAVLLVGTHGADTSRRPNLAGAKLGSWTQGDLLTPQFITALRGVILV
jgi:hypothetical protein